MKSKEEINDLAEIHANQEMEVYKSMDLPKGTKQAIFTHCLVSYNIGYNQCQEDVADEIKKQIYDFTIDLKEATSTFVKQNCEGAIFGLNRLLNSLNKQD